LLFSETRTPNRPVQTDEWNGQRVRGRAAQTQWQHSTTHVDWSGLYKDFTSGFRSDAGFVPQVGYRELSGFGAWTFRPKRIISQQRSALDLDYQADQSGAIITRSVQPNVFFQTRLSGYVRLAYIDDQTRAGDRVIGRHVSTARDPSLFVSRVDRQSGTFSGSALFAYKINWQSVMFVGYGDERETADARRLQPSERQLFVKLSYAFQR